MSGPAAELLYLAAAVAFIRGLKRLSSPATARRGNALAAGGMLLAIVVTLLDRSIVSYGTIAAGLAAGAVIGAVAARRVAMTAMPQLVAAFNGFGGGASLLVAAVELLPPGSPTTVGRVSGALTVLTGAVTLSGSMVAYGKLAERLPGRPIRLPLGPAADAVLAVAALAAVAGVIAAGAVPAVPAVAVLAAAGLLLGVTRTLPIGGADMPVVISLLNALSGLAAALAGFVISSNGLIIAGALVGASGMILTSIMVRAMNRTLGDVLFSGFGGVSAPTGAAGERTVRQTSPDDLAVMLGYASRVVVVPGYGLAVAQAQHALRELVALLEDRGVEVRFGIHPVAGRMPGHMNVLLAEADIPYDRLADLEEINGELPSADVALVVGANDVVNTAARDDPASPIAGMPIVEVDRARTVVVVKRSLSPGFAGIDNPLFYLPDTYFLFADARKGLGEVVTALKEL